MEEMSIDRHVDKNVYGKVEMCIKFFYFYDLFVEHTKLVQRLD